MTFHLRIVCVLTVALMLNGCGGGGGGESQPLPGKQATFTIGGNVTGLGTNAVLLALTNLDSNQAETLTVTGDNLPGGRNFTFVTGLPAGTRYAVSVRTAPTGLGCNVTSSSGTMASTAISNVTIACAPNTYNVGGTVAGLTGSGLVLRNNGGDDRSITSNGLFTFDTALANGAAYAITVQTQPSSPTQTCVVGNGNGASMSGSVTNVTVTCTTNNYKIGGSVTGLVGSGLVVRINGGSDLAINSNTPYELSALNSGSTYNVTVLTQPSTPNQTCTIANSSGTVTNAIITNVAITCTTNQYTISGTVSGLVGSGLVLLNNGGGNLAVNSSSFAFATQISGTPYNVSIFSQPVNPEQICSIINNIGTVNGHITNITLNCSTVPTMSVASATPAPDAIDILRNTNPTIDFSVAINGSTVTNSNVTLASSAGSQPITTTTLNNRVTVLPTTRLLPLTAYSLNVGTSVRGINNDRLLNPFTRRFTTADGLWHGRTLIDTGSTGSVAPQVAVNANGVAVATWIQFTDGQSSVWANRFNPNIGLWGVPTLIENDNSGGASSPQVAIDASGNAVVVWTMFDGTRFNLMANTFSVTTGMWNTTPVSLEPADGLPVQFALIASDNDHMIAAWTINVSFFGGSFSAVRTATYRFSTNSWSVAGPLAPGGGLSYSDGGVTLISNASGNTMAVWSRTTGQMSSQYSSASGTWSTPIPIPTTSTAFHAPSAAIDANGNALAVWSQSDSGESNVYASRYSAAAGQWNIPTLLETGTGTALTPRVAIDSAGNAIAIWQQQFGSSRYDIVTNRYSVGSDSWGSATLIETANVGSAENAQIAIDNVGNALAAWSYFDGTQTSIIANRYSVQSNTWGSPTLLETDNAGSANSISVVVDSAGSGMAVWGQDDGTRNAVYSNRFE